MTRARLPSALAIAIIAILALGPACGRAPAATSTPPAPSSATTLAGSAARPADPAQRSAPSSASDRELERYAERERETSGLERFAGGRGSQTTTIIIVLLVVILVLILI